MLTFEHQFWSKNPSSRLAGIDEAGRGPLAGPVVAGAVCIPQELVEALYADQLARLTDSKKLTESDRKRFFEILSSTRGVEIGVGMADPAEIDSVNILRATHVAMARAASALFGGVPPHALVDGLPVRGLPCSSTAIVKGDAKSFLIAAASIVAKVTRDAIMDDLDTQYPEYGFAKHKGYPTPAHLAALQKHGACPVHRQSYAPVAALHQPSLFHEYRLQAED